MSENPHWADDQLLLQAVGESPEGSRDRIQAHLECCSQCRVRLAELEDTLGEFGEAHRRAWATELPPAEGPRALLRAQMAELSTQRRGLRRSHSLWIALLDNRRGTALAAVAVAASLLLAIWLHQPSGRSGPTSASLGRLAEPDARLTPGATVALTRTQVCEDSATKPIPVVPASLRHAVFEEYGVTPPRPDAYEVDYLITPELGGATDIRNLWPEPYQDTVWNAHVKDQLEDLLHQMVCHGDVDLATAQHDISTDWIAAYRKYFHVEMPVQDASSSLNLSQPKRSRPLT